MLFKIAPGAWLQRDVGRTSGQHDEVSVWTSHGYTGGTAWTHVSRDRSFLFYGTLPPK